MSGRGARVCDEAAQGQQASGSSGRRLIVRKEAKRWCMSGGRDEATIGCEAATRGQERDKNLEPPTGRGAFLVGLGWCWGARAQ